MIAIAGELGKPVGLIVALGILACGAPTGGPDQSKDPVAPSPVELGGVHLVVDTLIPVLRIDGTSARFSEVGGVFASLSGVIAILQRQDNAVRLFGIGGKEIATFGRAGEGPGEFRFISRLGWIADTLWITDMGLRRVTLISPSGAFLRAFRYPTPHAEPEDSASFPVYGASTSFPWAILSDSQFVTFANERPGSPAVPEGVTASALLTGASGAIQRRIAYPQPDDAEGYVEFEAKNGPAARHSVPLVQKPQWGISPNGRYIAVTSALLTRSKDLRYFTVQVLSTSGDTVFSRDLSVAAVNVPPEVRASEMGEVSHSQMIRLSAKDPSSVSVAISNRIPNTFPGVTGLLVAEDGRVLLGQYSVANGQPWVVLDRCQGTPIASFIAPRGTFLTSVNQGLVYGVERDSVGVESAVVFRMPPAPKC